MKALEILQADWGFAMGARRITVSTSGITPKIVEFVNRYYTPAFYDDVLDVHVRTPEIRDRSFDLDYLVVRRRDSQVVATARTVFVFVDHKDWKAVPLPDWFRTAVEQYEGK